MNIVIDIRPLMDARYSGIAEYTLCLLRHLFELDRSNRYWLFYNSARDLSARMPVFDYPNVTVLKKSYPNKLLNYVFFKFLGWPRIDKLAGVPVDIVFLPHFNFAAFSPQAKVVLTIHDLSFFRYPEFFSWRKNLWHSLLGLRRLIRRADRIVAISRHTRDDVAALTGIDPQRISLIAPGLNPIFLQAGGEDTASVIEKHNLPADFILALGTIEPRKNIDGLIAAFERVKAGRAFTDLKLVIAGGRGWKAGPIYRAARSSACAADIIFLDYVDEADKPGLYRAARIFAYPSFYEGFGFPPLEAMACGTPTVAAAASSLPEVVGDGAVLIDPYNTEALATALREILTDRELADDLSETGRAQAARFSWEKTALQHLELFKEIGKPSSARRY